MCLATMRGKQVGGITEKKGKKSEIGSGEDESRKIF